MIFFYYKNINNFVDKNNGEYQYETENSLP